MERKKVTTTGPIKECCEFIAQSGLNGFEAITLANWLLTSFINANIEVVQEENLSTSEDGKDL